MTNNHKKRILIFSLAYYPVVGGAEIAIKEITDRIPDIEFDMVTLRFSKKHPKFEKIGNVNVYRIDTFKHAYPFKASSFAGELHNKHHYDAVWAMMANWAGFAAMFFKKRFPDVSFLLTLQEGDPIPEIKRKVWFVYPWFKQIFTRANKIQAISSYLADWADEMGAKCDVEVVPNGVDIGKFANRSVRGTRHEVVLITTSRLVKKNAVADLIRALKYLSDNVKLQILGVGPLEEELKHLVKRENLEHRVKFAGFVPQDNLPKHLHKADIFIRPSLSEGQGISFLEAMAAGLPVIATPVGGIPDFLVNRETGLFCNVSDPQSIADRVREFASNPELRVKIIKNAFNMVREKYDWTLVAEKMNHIFQNL